tara:strand:+ start:68 stop:478 length:411 start_codon:yes stop_codon:yes gene_type:complete
MSNQSCLLCGADAVRDTRPMVYTYKRVSFEIMQPGTYCDQCEESVLEPEDLKATLVDMQTNKARIDHLLTPKQIHDTRRRLGLTQVAAAMICGGGKNAFSRYENGEAPVPRATSTLLKLLDNHRELLAEVQPETSA